MNKIEEHLGVKIGERFKLHIGDCARYYFNSYYDLILEATHRPSKDYRFVDLLRNPNMIIKIPNITKTDFYILKYYYEKGYRYVTKDRDGEIWVWKNKPTRGDLQWYHSDGGGRQDSLLESLESIRWVDEKPTYILDLIKEVEQ